MVFEKPVGISMEDIEDIRADSEGAADDIPNEQLLLIVMTVVDWMSGRSETKH